ncbi:PAS domain-containing sensor histidine kinase [Sorangium sp. So ce1335]|uniref:sensor histidine kinase n=1 Tax=Sorangium sp. So ce1335 TaxID=3133335 RepID=UPI003F60F1CE
MGDDGPTGQSSRAPLGVIVGAACSILVGGAGLLGWSTRRTALISIARSWPSMVPTTALGLVLAGLSLGLLGREGRRAPLRRLGHASAVAVAVLGLVPLVQYVSGWDLGVDLLLFPARVDFPSRFPGRPSPNTALGLALIGAALLSLPVKTPRACRRMVACALAVVALALTVLTGYLLGVGYFYGLPPLFPFTGMPLHAAIALLALAVGLLTARPDCGAFATLTASAPGGVLLRRLLPLVVLVPIALGRLFLIGADLGAYPIAASFSLASAATTLFLASVLWSSAAHLNALDEARRRAEEARAFLATLAHSSEDVVVGTDLDGMIVSWNPAAERLHGHSAGEVIGRKVSVLYPPERAGEVEENLERLRRGERLEHFETVGLTRDGKTIDVEITVSTVVDDAGRVIGFSTICRDIGRRKAMEAALERAHAAERRVRAQIEAVYRSEASERRRLQAVLDQMPEAALLVDAEGRLVTCNRLALSFAIHREGERDPWGNAALFDHRAPSGEPVGWHDRPMTRALCRGEVVTGVEGQLWCEAERAFVPVLVNAAPVRSDDGEIQGAVAVFQDISALKELERQRQEWTGVVAHDLRQPIQVIATAGHLLRRRLGALPTGDGEKQLGRIYDSVDRLRRMIDDLLDASRIEAQQLTLEPRPVDLRAQLGEILERSAAATEGHRVRLEVRGDVPAVLADPGRLEQIVTNLLSNAARYGEPGRDIVVAVHAEADRAHIAVTNWGEGIPEAMLPHLFKRFWRAPGNGPGRARGVGLGLYITRGLVEAHGGSISVESCPGATTTFRFTLPLAAPAARPAGT